MAYPSDYRYNPFNDVSTAILAIERHIIPATSPYVISLNEVPQKTSPSTMTVTEIDGTGTAGASFAEVAAIPESGQFWADYSTGADGDQNWNTGKLQFNAADAGKLVEVTYTATGTLASVEAPLAVPPWCFDRGDGSDGDYVAANGDIIQGVKNYKSVYIPAGVTVRVGTAPLILKCQEACIINGTLNGAGNKGWQYNNQVAAASVGGSGAGGDGGAIGAGGNGGGGGGYGRTNTPGTASYFLGYQVGDAAATPSATWQYYMAQFLLPKAGAAGNGSSGHENSCSGGGGGGTITIAAETVASTLAFDVSGGLKSVAVGNTNYRRQGGGSGGASIHIMAKQLMGSGTISVKGGQAGDSDRLTAECSDGAAGWYKIFAGA